MVTIKTELIFMVNRSTVAQMAPQILLDLLGPWFEPRLDPMKSCFKKVLSLVIDNHGIIVTTMHWAFGP